MSQPISLSVRSNWRQILQHTCRSLLIAITLNCTLTATLSASQPAHDCSQRDADHLLLLRGLQHHLGYEARWDPELAAAYLHAAAYDGCAIAQNILKSMQDSMGEPAQERLDLRVKVPTLPPDIQPYFASTSNSADRTFNRRGALDWMIQERLNQNPVARYNLQIMQSKSDPTHHLMVHTPAYYRAMRLTIEDPAVSSMIEPAWQPAEHPDYAEHWLLAYHQTLAVSGMQETALEQLAHAIELGSQRARLHQIKYFPEALDADTSEDSTHAISGELQALLDEDYPPAWDLQCARLQAQLTPQKGLSNVDRLFHAVEKGIRYGYEAHPLRLLSTLMSRTTNPGDQQRAFALFSKAAALGMPAASFSVGFCYRSGWGVEPDLQAARHWFEKAQAHGDAAASFQLGWIQMQAQDYASAFQSFELAAEQRDELAQLQCALMTLEGIGTEADAQLAFRWFEAAADAGNATASLFCGYYHDNAWIEGQPRDLDQALYFYRQSVMALSDQSFDTFFHFLKERLAQPNAGVDAMLLTIDELLPWVPSQHLVNVGIACWQHPSWPASTRWDRAATYLKAAADKGDATGSLMGYVFSIHGYPGISATQAVAHLHSILEQPASSMDPRYRAKTVAGLSLAHLSGVGTPLDYAAFLELVEREPLPPALRHQLDALSLDSAAYRIYRNQSAHSDAYRRAQFRNRGQNETCPPDPVVQVAATYPRYLKELEIDGSVVLSMIIDTEGNILAPMVVESSHSGFEEPAMRALSHWRFLPALRDGKPVRARIRLPMVFRSD